METPTYRQLLDLAADIKSAEEITLAKDFHDRFPTMANLPNEYKMWIITALERWAALKK